MGTVADLIGTQFDRLTVVAFAGLDKHRKAMWICRCTCGQSTTAVTTELKKGHKRSCGCLKYEAKNIRHGMSGTQEHNIWRSIIQRTSNPKTRSGHRNVLHVVRDVLADMDLDALGVDYIETPMLAKEK